MNKGLSRLTASHGLIIYFLICLLFQNVGEGQSDLIQYTFDRPIMGTTFRLVIIHHNEDEAARASELAFERIEKINQVFSNYLLDSEAMMITTAPQTVSEDMWHILSLSEELYRNSEGQFDITIGPLSKLWRKALRRGIIPDEEELIHAHKSVGFENLSLNQTTKEVAFKKEGMLLDFGGIAKGYAVDEAYKILIENGIKYALVDGGGDIYAGVHPDNGWKVDVINSDQSLYLQNTAIASSGAQYQNLKKGDAFYSHIINPNNGEGVKDSETINILGPSCTIADALATIISISNDTTILQKNFKDYKKY